MKTVDDKLKFDAANRNNEYTYVMYRGKGYNINNDALRICGIAKSVLCSDYFVYWLQSNSKRDI
jgi:hypothetical protein